MKKGWLVGFLGALGCVVLGDAASILCQYFEIEGFASTVSWMVPLAGFVYFFFFKFWRDAEAIDASIAGRLRRRSYFLRVVIWSVVVNLVSTGVVIAVSEGMKLANEQSLMFEWLSVLLSSSILTLIVFGCVVRRLHDMGWTCKVAKWQVLIAMLSLMGFMFPTLAAIVIVVGYIPNLVLNLIVLFHVGSTGENKYGANPRNK